MATSKNSSLATGFISLQNLMVVSLLIMAHSTNDAYAGLLSPLLPSLQDRFAIGETLLASFVATVSFSSNVLQPVFGAISDRFGARKIAAIGIIAGACLMSLIGIVPNVSTLFILLIIGGLGSAAFHPAAVTIVRTATSEIKNKTLTFGIFTSAGPLGNGIGPLVVLALIAALGLSATPWLMIPGILFGIAIFLLAPKAEKIQKKKDAQSVSQTIRNVASFVIGPVGALALVGIFRSVTFVSFLNSVPLWLVEKGYASDSLMIAWTLFTYNAASAFGIVMGGWLEPRIGRWRIIIGSTLLAFPACFVFLFMPIGSVAYFVSIIIASILVNCCIASLVISAQDLAPNAVGAASGMLMGLTWGMAGIIYIGIGALQERIGIQPSLYVAFSFLLLASLLAFAIFRTRLGQKQAV